MSNFTIVIPSYHRANLIKSKSLKTIEKYFGTKYEIYIFTPHPDEYFDIPDHIKVEKCPIGLIKARNAIMEYFNVNEKLFILDDDIDDFEVLNDCNLINEINISFEIMKNNKIHLGGFNPTGNAYFANGKYKIGLQFCVGCAYLLINDRHYMDVNDELEDYHRSIEYYVKDGSTFRNDKILIKTRYESNKGGMFSLDRYKNKNKEAIHLLLTYPHLVQVKMKSKYLGVKLRKNSRTEIIKVQYNAVGLINGQYSKHTKSPLNPKKNYFFMDGNKMVGYILRNIYRFPDNFKYTVEHNENSGDIAGIIKVDKMAKYMRDKWSGLEFNKQKTRTSKNANYKFEVSNSIKRKSKYICDCSQMQNIYDKLRGMTYFNDCNKVIINKNLCSGFHRDAGNDENYILLLTHNNKLILDIPEYNLVLNNQDGDIVCFDAKGLLHGNNEGECKDRYSIVFYSSKKKKSN